MISAMKGLNPLPEGISRGKNPATIMFLLSADRLGCVRLGWNGSYLANKRTDFTILINRSKMAASVALLYFSCYFSGLCDLLLEVNAVFEIEH